ncbi:MAG: arginine--tRNA ligase, partial [Patescibacteria group bacterium]
VAKILGLDKAELSHVKYGLVLGEGSKKLATREGRTIMLNEVLDKSVKLAYEVVNKKNPDLDEKKKREVAEAVGVGALKYNDLKENRMSDIVFDWERMLDLSGQSAPYLQYTYARLKSILRKAGKAGRGKPSLFGDTELEIVRKIIEFPYIILESAKALGTSGLALYVYELGVLANRLYEKTPVIKEENENKRNALLGLIGATSTVLARGLRILGIRTPEEI